MDFESPTYVSYEGLDMIKIEVIDHKLFKLQSDEN